MADRPRPAGHSPLRCGGVAAAFLLALLMPAPSPAAGPQVPDPAYGEYLSSQCVACHRKQGASEGSIPPIVGLPPAAFVDALLAYQSGERDNQVMRNVTSALGVEEIAALAAYFATLSTD